MSLNASSRAFLDRLRVGVSSTMDLSRLSEWLVRNTKHPKDNSKPWSFDGHEFQREILNDTAHRVVVRKCSQVGVSELTVRMILGLLSLLRNHTAIYTLPTRGFASNFAQSRFDPVIEASPVLSEMIDPDIDNTQLKRLGTSFLYILGTFTQGQAISIPADILVNDEVDFSDAKTLTTFASRLGHAVNGGIRREFSTPTVNGYGISKTMDISSHAQYGVRCDCCHQVVFPDFFDNVVVPGFDDELDKFSADDLQDPRYDVQGAQLLCPDCRGVLTIENLADPEKREWVHRFPDRPIRGYQVYPFDVPLINPPSRTLQQMEEYERKADWVNFKVGLPYEDAETSFLLEAMKNNQVVNPVNPREGAASGCVLGCDVGKTSWAVIGRPVDRRIDIIWAEKIRQDGDGALLKRLIQLVNYFGVVRGVIDAGPDFTTSMAFVTAFPMGRIFANYYTRAKSKKTLSFLDINDEEGITTSVRTESFDLVVKKVNTGKYRFPRNSDGSQMIEHLGNLKRVEVRNNSGDLVANWVTNGPDHYGHALNYLNIAATLLDHEDVPEEILGVLPMATVVRLKTPTIRKIN